MSPQKSLDVRIFCTSQRFVCSAEDDLALTHHHHFAVDETKPLALALENHFAVFVYYSIFGTDVLEIVHLVSHEDRRHVFEIAKFHRQLAECSRSRRIETCCRLVKQNDLRIAHECARDTDAPAHAARKLDRHLVDRIFEIYESQHATNFRLHLVFRHTLFMQAKSDVVVNRKRVEESAF